MNIERLENVRRAGEVVRFHTVPLHRTQNIAQHSYGVAHILLEICPSARAELIRAALLHDYPELFTGDVPSTTKWKYPELEEALKIMERDILISIDYPDLTPAEKRLLKFADMLEGALFCTEEYERGSKEARTIAVRFLRALEKRSPQDCPGAVALILRIWQRLEATA